jgi:hypothetical protein
VKAFREPAAVCRRQVFDAVSWVDRMREAVEDRIARPGALLGPRVA